MGYSQAVRHRLYQHAFYSFYSIWEISYKLSIFSHPIGHELRIQILGKFHRI